MNNILKLGLFGVSVLSLSSCVKNSDYELNNGLTPDEILKFVAVSPVSIPANGVSSTSIKLATAATVDQVPTITLQASDGIINGKSASESTQVNLNRVADFEIKASTTPGTVHLRASVLDSDYRDTTIVFTPSYPDVIEISPASFSISSGTSLAIQIQLRSFVGTPSTGQFISLSAKDENGNDVPGFSLSATFSPGMPLAATFTPPSDVHGKITLTVSVRVADGTEISGMTKVTINS